MTSYRTLVSSLLLASSLGALAAPAVAAPTVAAPPDCRQAGPRGMAWEHRAENMAKHHQKLHDALQLTPDQDVAWTRLMNSERPMTQADPGKPEDLAKLTTPERAQKMLEHMKEHQALMAEHVAALKDFYALLTPEQRKSFDDFHSAPPAGMRSKPQARSMDKAPPKPGA